MVDLIVAEAVMEVEVAVGLEDSVEASRIVGVGDSTAAVVEGLIVVVEEEVLTAEGGEAVAQGSKEGQFQVLGSSIEAHAFVTLNATLQCICTWTR